MSWLIFIEFCLSLMTNLLGHFRRWQTQTWSTVDWVSWVNIEVTNYNVKTRNTLTYLPKKEDVIWQQFWVCQVHFRLDLTFYTCTKCHKDCLLCFLFSIVKSIMIFGTSFTCINYEFVLSLNRVGTNNYPIKLSGII